jgi:protein phosphatase 1 regulatory subunit 37
MLRRKRGNARPCYIRCLSGACQGLNWVLGFSSVTFQHARHAPPRSVDFSGVQLTLASASVLSDVFTIEWGLRKLIFKECDLDEHVRNKLPLPISHTQHRTQILKPILHSLLIPGSLTYLSVASNRRLKVQAFRVIGAYLSKV